MEETTEVNNTKKRRGIPVFSWFRKNFYLIIMLLLAFFVISSITLIMLSKTHKFRSWASDIVLNFVNNELAEGAKLNFDDIEISYLLGLKFTNISVTLFDDTVLTCKSLHAGFKLLPLLNDKIVVNEVFLVNPDIRLSRSKSDSLWNYNRLIKPSEDTTESEVPDWIVEVNRVAIYHGNIIYYDSTIQKGERGKLDENHIFLKDLNLSLKANIDLKKSEFDVGINHLSFQESHSGFALLKFKTDVFIDSNVVNIYGLLFETPESEINIKAQMQNFNIFSSESDINKANFDFDFESDGIEIEEIKKLIPGDLPISGKVNFELAGKGNLKKINLDIENLAFGNSKLSFTSVINNIDNDKFSAEVIFDKSNLHRKDLSSIILLNGVRDLPEYGEININVLEAKYSKDSIYAKFDLDGLFGKVIGSAGISPEDDFSYSGTVETTNLDLSVITGDGALKSSINTNAVFSGKSFVPEKAQINLKLDLTESKLMDYTLNKVVLRINTPSPGLINLDTLQINLSTTGEVDKESINLEGKERISISGLLDLREINLPKYDITAVIKNTNPSKILNEKILPEFLDAEITMIGEGIEPDSINSKIGINISKWKYHGKLMKPRKLSIDIKRDFTGNKELNISSGFIDLELSGKFNYNQLIGDIQFQLENTENYLANKIDGLFPDVSKQPAGLHYSIVPMKFGDKNEFDLKCSIKDNDLIANVLGFKDFKSDLNLDLHYLSNNEFCTVTINEFNVKNLLLNDGKNNIVVTDFSLNGKAGFNYTNTNNITPNFDINFSSKEGIEFNDINITEIKSIINLNNNDLKLQTSAFLNQTIILNTDADIKIGDHDLDLVMNKLSIDYLDKMSIHEKEPISIKYSNNEVTISKLSLTGPQIGLVDISGVVSPEKFDKLKIRAYDFNLSEIWKLIPNKENDYGEILNGKLDSILIEIDGSPKNTDEDISLSMSNLTMNGSKLGNISANLTHRNSLLTGDVFLSSGTKNLMELKLKKIPLNLSIDFEGERLAKNKPIELTFETKKFPLELLSPFITEVSGLKGLADIKLNLNGKNFDDIDYNGSIEYSNTRFNLTATNMNYYSDGKILFKKDTITISKIRLVNDKADLKGGEVIAKGKIYLDNMDLKAYNIKVYADKFQVLNLASMKPMPSLYGDFIISFGPSPLQIFGDLESPYIKGDINILKAALIMPSDESKSVKKSKLKYEVKDDKSVVFTVIPDSTANNELSQNNETKKKDDNSGFSDKLDIDVSIKFKGRFIVTLDISSLGKLFAEIGTPSPDDVLRYVDVRGPEEPRIYGTDILVKEGSNLKLIKMLETTGAISFPKGLIDNPGLDLTAVYKGQRFIGNEQSSYIVKLFIKGTKELPSISFSYSIDGVEETGDSSRINEDAILLLVLGKRKAELSPGSGVTSGMSVENSLATSVASTVASSALTDFVQGSQFIQSADIDVGNSLQNLDQARMSFSGEVQGVRWTLGGTVADFANNNEISIDIPVSWPMRNILLQLTKITNATSSGSKIQKDFEIKLKWGKSW